ncbi:MAG: ATP-binding protein [Deltaproteobacteria bacterium]|nr:ATP-binding protein [Deltaproteobacteria bacterium]
MNRSDDYHPRALALTVESALKAHPVVVLSGARQTGKTTLTRHLPSASTRLFQTLDDLDVFELARKRPHDLLAMGPRLTLDEVQRVPELLLAIKKTVDQRREPGQFLLTGSANLLLMRHIADSLTGRAVYLLLSPFTGGEKRGDGTVPPWSRVLACKSAAEAVELLNSLPVPQVEWMTEVLRGGMPPAVFAETTEERALWFDGFVRTYLERDLREVSQVSALPDFRRLMQLAVHRLGQLMNQTELGRDAGLAQATTHRYLNLLETTFQLHRLPPFAVNATKRLIKTPKLYWADTGLAAHLAGFTDPRDIYDSRLAGALLENLLFSAFLAWRETVQPKPEIFYWRTAGGAEVDFVIERGPKLLPLEVKTARQITLPELRHLETFLTEYPTKATWGAVLHQTDQARLLTPTIASVPLATFL